MKSIRFEQARARVGRSFFSHARFRFLTRTVIAFATCGTLQACGGEDGSDGDSDALPYGPDGDGDGWPRDFDCDDNDAAIFPSADDEPGDGIDQDCSGSDARDAAGGTAGAPATGGSSGCDDDCATGGGGGDGPSNDHDGDGSVEDFDCDDLDPSIRPGRLEIVLDGIDQNCDGSDLPDFDVREDVLGDDAVAAEAPALAVGATDDDAPIVIAVWADSRTAPRQDLYARAFDGNGDPLGDEFAIDAVDNHAKFDVSIASKGDGFLVTWSTAEGVFCRILDASGAPSSIVLGIGADGGALPRAAFGGGHWAIAWARPNDQEASIRAMDTVGVRGDILDLGAAGVNRVALLGTEDGFFAAWDGLLVEGDGAGISGQFLDALGAPDGGAFDLVEEASAPALARTTTGIVLAYRIASGLGYVAGRQLDDAGTPGDAVRLSSESPAQTRLQIATDGDTAFVAWNDARHVGSALSAGAIYGSDWTDEDAATPGSFGLHAGTTSELGGIVRLGEYYLLSVRTEDGTAWVFR